jgi:hypothetical protein
MKNNIILLFFLALFLVNSCEQDVTLEFNNEPKLCLNCILNPDSLITASLTLSHSLDNSGKFEAVNNAVITLYEEDNIKGTLKLKSDGKYILNQKPIAGKMYYIEAKVTGYQSIKAKTIVPEKPIIIYTKDTVRIIESVNRPIMNISVAIMDKVGNNFYWLYGTCIFKGRKDGGSCNAINSPYVDTFNRLIDSDSKYGFNHFLQIRMTDDGFNGEELRFIIPDMAGSGNDLQSFMHFLSADEHYDKHIKTTLIKRMSENDDLPFYEPVQIYSNIENGYGIFGSCAITTIKL